jgi:hypothetical protein
MSSKKIKKIKSKRLKTKMMSGKKSSENLEKKALKKFR